MSLCFLQAFAKAHSREFAIPQKDYFNHLLAHFRGVRHPQDSISGIGETLAKLQPWVGSLREVALASDYKPLEGKLGALFPERTNISRHFRLCGDLHALYPRQNGQLQVRFTNTTRPTTLWARSAPTCRLSRSTKTTLRNLPFLSRTRRDIRPISHSRRADGCSYARNAGVVVCRELGRYPVFTRRCTAADLAFRRG